ncbi:unnamed protein product [Discula destructiva]
MSGDDQEQMMVDDWRAAVEDLKDNVRHEIITLTNLARELTTIAYPIADVLEQHIKKAPPQRKLPAIYLLDSIVKNVGTPYTLFFGKNLYQTFMEVYASVDQRTRQKLEEMLQTWKEPVPGSIDSTPVFPPDVIRPIENALLKARTTALQAQQEQARRQMGSRGSRPPMPGFRATPTPPNARQPFKQPTYPAANGARSASAFGQQTYLQPLPYPATTPQPPPSTPVVAPFAPPQTLYGASAAQPEISIDSLNSNIEQLIVAVGTALGRSPHSPDIQTELKALMALQGLLRDKHRNLPREHLVAVRNQVDHLAVKYGASFTARQSVTPTPPIAAAPFHAPMHYHQQGPLSVAPVAPTPPAAASVSLDSLFGRGALAALLNRSSATPQPPRAPTPQTAAAAISDLRSPVPTRAEPAAPATPDPMALLSALRGSGLLPPSVPQRGPSQTVVAQPPAPSPPVAATPTTTPLDLASILAKAQTIAATAKAGPVLSSGGFQLTATSLKQFRPHLFRALYDGLGPPCTQCGRRFATDDEGKQKKTAHMDWHFRVHQRMIEAEKRGQHRSWYVDQVDWLRNVESVDLDQTEKQDDASNANAAAAAKPQIRFIRVPDRDDNTNSVCPICQEKFETKWLDEAQEWVWMDVVKVGDRAFHASCYVEVTKESAASAPLYGGGSRATPDRVLGKRKAEDEILSVRDGRVKTES